MGLNDAVKIGQAERCFAKIAEKKMATLEINNNHKISPFPIQPSMRISLPPGILNLLLLFFLAWRVALAPPGLLFCWKWLFVPLVQICTEGRAEHRSESIPHFNPALDSCCLANAGAQGLPGRRSSLVLSTCGF